MAWAWWRIRWLSRRSASACLRGADVQDTDDDQRLLADAQRPQPNFDGKLAAIPSAPRNKSRPHSHRARSRMFRKLATMSVVCVAEAFGHQTLDIQPQHFTRRIAEYPIRARRWRE